MITSDATRSNVNRAIRPSGTIKWITKETRDERDTGWLGIGCDSVFPGDDNRYLERFDTYQHDGVRFQTRPIRPDTYSCKLTFVILLGCLINRPTVVAMGCFPKSHHDQMAIKLGALSLYFFYVEVVFIVSTLTTTNDSERCEWAREDESFSVTNFSSLLSRPNN